jgi:hypothetical protein
MIAGAYCCQRWTDWPIATRYRAEADDVLMATELVVPDFMSVVEERR